MLTWHAYRDLLTGAVVERPLLPAREAVDMFFMALSFFIVAVGLVQLSSETCPCSGPTT